MEFEYTQKGGKNHMFKRKPFIFLLFSFCAISVFIGMSGVTAAEDDSGTTYYVSTLNGQDDNSGKSEDQAFFSLQKINEIDLQPGDKVLLEAGSVFENDYLHVKGSGAKDAPIIVDRYGDGDDPKIETNGKGVWYQDYRTALDNPEHKYKGDVSSSILLYDVEYIELNNLDISNDSDMDADEYSDLDRMDRTGVAAVAQNKGTIDHIYLNDLNIHDVRGNVYNKHMNNGGIYFTVFKPENEDETGIARYNDIVIEDNTVNDVSRWGIAVGYTAYYSHFADSEISDETIDKYGSSNVEIRNNYVKDPGGDAITTMYLDRPLVEYNVSDGAANDINDDVYTETSFGKTAAAIWPWKSKKAIFQYNEAFDTHENQDGQAWDADSGDGTVYQYNYSHNNGGGAVMICCDQSVNSVFRYNISENDKEGVLSLPANPEAKFYNNTFYVKEDVPLIRDSMTGGVAVLENNIIYHEGDSKEEDWTKNSNVTYRNNIYYNYKNTPESDDAAITEDPQLTDPGSGPADIAETDELTHDRDIFNGYQLKGTSPAIENGKSIDDNGGLDFFGNEITEMPAIGASEYVRSEVDSVQDVKKLVEQFEDENAFNNDHVAHALTIHLTAVEQFEKKKSVNKVIKHMKSFQDLLYEHKEQKQISEESYNELKSAADSLIKTWE